MIDAILLFWKNALLPSVLMVIAMMRMMIQSCFHGEDFPFFISNIIIIIISRQEATMTMFAGHVIVAIFAEPDSPLLGLR